MNDDSALRAIKDGTGLSYGADHLTDFEQRYCYDRFSASAGAAPNTRFLCSGARSSTCAPGISGSTRSTPRSRSASPT